MFDNYWDGGGDISLSKEEFQMIVSAAQFSRVMATHLIGAASSQRGSISTRRRAMTAQLARSGSSFNDAGKAVGFNDNYNFDWQSGRTGEGEWKTRVVGAAGFVCGAKPFKISYGTYYICQRVIENEIGVFTSCGRTVGSLLPAVLLSCL